MYRYIKKTVDSGLFLFLISFRLKMRWKNMTLPFKAVAVDMDGTFLDDRKQMNNLIKYLQN